MVDSKEAQSAFFELMSKSVKNESSDQQSPAHSGATETGILRYQYTPKDRHAHVALYRHAFNETPRQVYIF